MKIKLKDSIKMCSGDYETQGRLGILKEKKHLKPAYLACAVMYKET